VKYGLRLKFRLAICLEIIEVSRNVMMRSQWLPGEQFGWRLNQKKENLAAFREVQLDEAGQ